MYDNEADNEEDPQNTRTTRLEEEKLRDNAQERVEELKEQLSAIKARLSHKKRSNDDKINDQQQQVHIQEELLKCEEVLAEVTGKINKRDEAESKIWCQSLDIAMFLLQNTNQVIKKRRSTFVEMKIKYYFR